MPALLVPAPTDASTAPFTLIARSALKYYQSSLSVKSVSRCPFEISCSNFALHAVQRYGVAGIPLIIDRYFYRENVEAFSLYKRTVSRNGVVKLDDALFLYPFE